MSYLNDKLNTIQEFTYQYGLVKILLCKTPDGQHALVIDKAPEQQKRKIKSFFRNFPFVILFKGEKDISKIAKRDTTIDTEAFESTAAQKLFKKMKIIQKGTAKIESDTHNLIIKNLNLKPFAPKSVFVVRLDYSYASKISKTTNEVPATSYYRLKEEDISEIADMAGQFFLINLIVNLAFIFSMFGIFKLASKRRPRLEKKFNDIIKDGKKWKVYVIKEDSPNAFCMIRPVMFIHSGLLKKVNDRELMAIMLHEAGHIKDMAVWKSLAASQALYGIILLLPTGLPVVFFILFALLYNGLQTVLISRLMGRAAERKADNFAVKNGYATELISALKKIHAWSDKQIAKRPCGKVCQASNKVSKTLDEHPPLEKRVEQILKQKETWEKTQKMSFMQLRGYFAKGLDIKEGK